MRASGILLDIASLHSHSGVGTLADVEKLIDFLREAKQRYWQIAPVNPTVGAGTLRALSSSIAANTLLIDADELAASGLICEETLLASKCARGCDLSYAVQHKEAILREAFVNFEKMNPSADFVDFCDANAWWLDDYSLFCALKERFANKPWWQWDDGARLRNVSALESWRNTLADEIDFVVFCQYIFDKQWRELRKKLASNGIKLIGTIPLHLSYDSADVWAHPDLFIGAESLRFNATTATGNGRKSIQSVTSGIARCDFRAMKRNGYKWWSDRLNKCAERFDLLRISDFSAPESYFAVKWEQKILAKRHLCGKDELAATCKIFDGFAPFEVVFADTSLVHCDIKTLASSTHELVVYCMQDLLAETASIGKDKACAPSDPYYMIDRGDLSQANAKYLSQLTIESNRVCND